MRLRRTFALSLLVATAASGCQGGGSATPSSPKDLAARVVSVSGAKVSYDEADMDGAWKFMTPMPPVDSSSLAQTSAHYWSANNQEHLEGMHFQSAQLAQQWVSWVNGSHPAAQIAAAAQCGSWVVAGNIGAERDLVSWLGTAFSGCQATTASPTTTPSASTTASAAPSETDSSAPTAQAATTTAAPVTAAPKPHPAPLRATATAADGTAAFVLTAFTVTGTDSPVLHVKVRNTTGHQAALSPTITLTGPSGELTFDGTDQCWTFAPHETDTLTLPGTGLADATGTWAKAEVENAAVDC